MMDRNLEGASDFMHLMVLLGEHFNLTETNHRLQSTEKSRPEIWKRGGVAKIGKASRILIGEIRLRLLFFP
jgi:hypothetical protein